MSGLHQTTARKKWTKEDKKFVIICYLKAKEEGQRGHRKQLQQYWIEEGRFETEKQNLACQIRSILKNKRLLEIEIEAFRRKVRTPKEPVKMLIENDPVEGSNETSEIEIGVEKNHPAADGGMEGTDELHQNDDT